MNRKTSLAAGIAAFSLMGLAGTAQAVPAVVAPSPQVIVVQSAPPPPIAEAVPGPRDGFVWTPGHYELRNGSYVWHTGRWIEDRPGWVWQEARWQQRPDGSWVLAGGHWARGDTVARYDASRHGGANGDLDGDGVLNRDDRDRDGDGVLNWDDARPRNPLRQ